ncbi:GGDEF domain-containing protein, partial [Kaarinaea lacus]
SFFELFEDQFQHAQDSGHPLSCLMIDIDHFKSINDTYGHITGDHVLAAMGDILRQTYPDDMVVRFGGEEFCILARCYSREDILKKAEQLRIDVANLNPAGVNVTISIGLAGTDDHPDLPVNEFIRQADLALYYAKENGRNQVCFTSTEGPQFSPYQEFSYQQTPA